MDTEQDGEKRAGALETRPEFIRTGQRSMAAAVVVCATVLEIVVLGAWAYRRGVNADEGFYLAAARAVTEGRRLYRDVFFPQMPYLPWLLAGVFQAFAPSLVVGRLVSVLAGGVSAGVLAWTAWRLEPRASVAMLAAAFYLTAAVLLSGLTVVKAASLVNACLLLAFAPLAIGLAREPRWAFFAGVAAGAAIGLRLAVAPVCLLFALFALPLGRRAFLAYALGGVAGSLPWLAAAVSAPDQFWFCNVTFHGLRREITGLPAIVHQKAGVLAKWFFLPQHVILWSLAAWGVRLDRRRVWPAAVTALVIGATYLAATPTYLEYMTQIYPFAILAALPAIAVLARRRWLLAAVLAVYLVGLYPLLKTAAPGSGVGAKRALWQRALVGRVSDYLSQHTQPGEPVLSWWEGYPVLAGRPGFLGVGFWESNVARKLEPAAARRYGVRRREEVRGLIERREAAMIVVADGIWKSLGPAIEAGYAPAARFGAVQIFARANRAREPGAP